MSDTDDNFNYFTKCFHLEGEVGAFIFFKGEYNILNYLIMDTFPTIYFKYYDSSSIKDYFSPAFTSIELNQKVFNNYPLLNDFIKISNKKLCFISTSDTKQELYIFLFHIFEIKKIIIRYYTLEIYNKYSFKFMYETRGHLYNNYIAYAFSFYHQSECENKNNPHNVGFMIFSYPNGTHYNLNLTEYLFNNNNIKINNLFIDLKNNVRIDNNIFGLVYSGIEIKEINNCSNISFISSLNENTYIEITSNLKENEKIKIVLNSYNAINCLIKYIYIITEPGFNEYNSFSTRITTFGEDTEDIFNEGKSTYESRVLNYYIEIDKDLTTLCNDTNCELCLDINRDYCITCKYNYTLYDEVNIKYKKCFPNPILDRINHLKFKFLC